MATESPGSSIGKMISQSREILTRRDVATFDKYEKDGTLRDAIVYIAIAAALSGLAGLAQGPANFVGNVLITVFGFLVFVYLVHWLGTQRGGTGTLDEVAYSFALFWAPISVLTSIVTVLLVITLVGIFLIPLLVIAALVVNVWFAYLATQASLNLEPGGKTWSVLLLAAIGSFVVNLLVGALLAF